MSSAAATAPLLSAQWFRVASLRPQLDTQVQIERVSYRRRHWFVLVRSDGSRSFRLNAAAYAFAARCDGRLSMQRLWELLLAEFKDDAPTQDELLQLASRLRESGLLGFDRRPDFGTTTAATADAATDAQKKNSLLSFRIPMGRPDGWLTGLHLAWPGCSLAARCCWGRSWSCSAWSRPGSTAACLRPTPGPGSPHRG